MLGKSSNVKPLIYKGTSCYFVREPIFLFLENHLLIEICLDQTATDPKLTSQYRTTGIFTEVQCDNSLCCLQANAKDTY